MTKFKELFEQTVSEVTDDDVQYYYQLADDAKKAKKSKKETQKILKDAGAPRDIIADLTQRMKVFEAKTPLRWKTELRKTIAKEDGYLVVNNDKDGSWEISKTEPKSGEYYKLQDLRDYYGYNYNVKTSISVAMKDIDKGKFDQSEVGR